MKAFLAGCVLGLLVLSGCESEKAGAPLESYPDARLKAIKPGNMGVVLAWKKGSTPSEKEVNDIALGQTLMVRVRNLDGWLITKLLDNRITGEPDMTPGPAEQLRAARQDLEG